MNGSGLLILNAPFQLDARLAPALKALAQTLGERQASARVEWIMAPP